MSLQVWLPLTGHLNNQGLSNVTVTNNGATVDNNGKIGKCYSFDGTDDKITNTLPATVSSSIGTLACWVKFNAFPQSASGSGVRWYSLIQLGALGGFATCRLGLYMEYTNVINISIDGSEISKNAYTHSLSTNTWYHLCATYDGTLVKLYINGSQVMSKTATKGTYATAASYLYCGATNNYWTNGYMNDIRYYDHALSEKEVKELSKGLVLHYPLTGGGRSGDNLLKNSNINISNTSYPTATLQLNPAPAAGDMVTISIKGQLGTGKSYWGIYNSGGTVGLVSIYESDKKNGVYKKTFNWTINTASNTNVYIYPIPSSVSATSSIEWVKLEYGNNATTWMPNSADAAYTAMGYNSTTEYDVSGYNNHGTKTNITYSSDTARYAVASMFNGTDSNITVPFNTIVPEGSVFTINLWFKKDALGSKSYETLFGGPSGFEMDTRAASATTLSFYMTSVRGGNVFSPFEFSKWYMVTMVSDGTNEMYYVDGDLKKTITKQSMPAGNYFLGCWKNATSQNYYGLLSDFRIYATALTADDVKELYNTAASLANNGTLFAYDFVEV